MFGEENIYLQTTCSIDRSNRIIIPKKTLAEANDILVILVQNEDYFSLYNIKEIHQMIEKLKEENKTNKVRRIYCNIVDTINVNKDRRISLPMSIVDLYSLSESIYVQGEDTHLNIYRSKEKFLNHKRKI